MAYNEDSRGGYRGPDDHRGGREPGRGGPQGGERGGRGFFERAGDEISSWFGDGEAEQRRAQDDRSGGGGGRQRERPPHERHQEHGGGWFGGGSDRDRHEPRSEQGNWFGGKDRQQEEHGSGWFGGGDPSRQREQQRHDQQRDQDRAGWRGGDRDGGNRAQGYGARPMGGYREDQERDREQTYRSRDMSREQYGHDDAGGRRPWEDQGAQRSGSSSGQEGYRPFAGDYGRTGGSGGRSFDHDQGRHEPNRGVGAGSTIGSAAGGHFGDPHYQEWRQRQIDQLDRDYDEYRREHQSKFDNDFTGWRTQRQSQRQLIGQVREHMDVVGSDGQSLGKVDKIQGDRIVLTKSSEGSGGVHRSFSCSSVDRVEGDRLILRQPADQARRELREEPGFVERGATDQRGAIGGGQQQQGSGQAQPTGQGIGEGGEPLDNRSQGDGQGEGPHNLERSFSGTYR